MVKLNSIYYSPLLLTAVLFVWLSFESSVAAQNGRQRKPPTPRDLTDKQSDYENNSRRAAPKDAFPVFDNPKMTAANKTNVDDQEYVIGIECDGVSKAYPISVMGRHELGNDVCGKTHITVSW